MTDNCRNNKCSCSCKGSSPLKIVALVSGGGTTVKNIHECISAGLLNAEIVHLIASKDCRGVGWAAEQNISSDIIARRDFDTLEDFSAAVTAAVAPHDPDLIILAGYLQLWKFPAKYNGRVMNIHPALLPGFGGKGMWGHHVHEAVLAAGCKVSGCTVHFCDFQYDTGPIIVQKTVDVFDTDTPDELAARVFQQECKAYPEAIRLFSEGKLAIDGPIVKISK